MAKVFKTLTSESAGIDKKFKNRWDIKTRLINLSEEVGELSHDILIIENLKNDKPYAKSIGANITNLLYELFLIANYYHRDLDKDWETFLKEMPGWAKMRNKKVKNPNK